MTRVGGDGELAEVRHALAGYVTGLQHLVKVVDDAGLAQLGGGTDLVEFMQTFEQSRNLLPLIDHAVMAVAARLDLPTQLCEGWIDPNQKPIVNTRIQALQLGRQTRQTRAP